MRLLPCLLLLGACAAPRASSDSPAWRFLLAKYDADGDQRIRRAEYTRSPLGFSNLDADRDGVLTAADFDAQWDGIPRVPDPQAFVYGEGGPELGDPAPDFRLATTGGEVVQLSALRGRRPVALVFGSFT